MNISGLSFTSTLDKHQDIRLSTGQRQAFNEIKLAMEGDGTAENPGDGEDYCIRIFPKMRDRRVLTLERWSQPGYAEERDIKTLLETKTDYEGFKAAFKKAISALKARYADQAADPDRRTRRRW